MEITNKNIASQFNLLAKLMELHQENKFKIRSYQNAYQTLRKYSQPLSGLKKEELLEIEGIGEAIADKILVFVEQGSLPQLDAYLDKTPAGIRELLSIRGLGPKKIRQLWDELEIESPGELLYACKENRLVDLKGMGAKSQLNIQAQLEFYLRSRDSVRLDQAMEAYEKLYKELDKHFRSEQWALTGDLRRMMPTLNNVEILVNQTIFNDMAGILANLPETEGIQIKQEKIEFLYHQIKFEMISSISKDWFADLLLSTGGAGLNPEPPVDCQTEEAYFKAKGWPYIPAELRDHPKLAQWLEDYQPNDLVEISDIKGLVHCHTDWSDGGESLEQMVVAAKEKGFEYITITDHSKAAFYANGLDEERLARQLEAIEKVKHKYDDIEVLSGCEVDILNDGEIDLDDDILSKLDLVIASVHSNLKMDRDKAMQRLLRAVEHPQVDMLGHPTGRLILAREGYPVDHKKLIDACAANNTAIEINANPLRLDIDWKWIPYCMEKGVMISINPDAHAISQMDFIRYGVMMGRKGGLLRSQCLNAKNAEDFKKLLKK